MLKVMNLLILTLSMNILMSISSNAEVAEADKERCRETFNDLDCDKNERISEVDVNSFFSDREKLKKIDGMILDKEKFKESLLHEIKNNGEMDLDAFVRFLYKGGDSFEEVEELVKKVFHSETNVKREEICEKFEKLESKKEELKASYTIEEFTQFVFYNQNEIIEDPVQ